MNSRFVLREADDWRGTDTEAGNVLFSSLTMNPARLHLDAFFAAETEFG